MIARRLLVVGEAPSAQYGGRPLQGDTGRRLAALAGVGHGQLLAAVDAVNLFDAWPGPENHGSAFPVREARDAAVRLLATITGRRVLLLGGRVVAAFGLVGLEPFRWHDVDIPRIADGRSRLVTVTRVAVVPHPSGVSRSYNDPRVRAQAAEFLGAALDVPRMPTAQGLPLRGATT